MAWRLVESEILSAQENMDKDKSLLEQACSDCFLHVYNWKTPSITHGYFLKPESFLRLDQCKKEGLDLGKRITGGGVVFHVWDLAFSVLIPSSHPLFSENTLDNYALINNVVLEVVKPLLPSPFKAELTSSSFEPLGKACEHFCMARPTIYDVVLDEKKIAGAAQRRTKKGFLHQGTISILEPDVNLLNKVLISESVLQAMCQTTYSLLPKGSDRNLFIEMQRHIKQELYNQLIKQIS